MLEDPALAADYGEDLVKQEKEDRDSTKLRLQEVRYSEDAPLVRSASLEIL